MQLRPQQTLSRPVEISGFGFWSGKDVRLRLVPAAADHGIVFVREDLRPAVRIEAAISRRIETPRRTTLSANGATVEMVEHVLAALAGLQVDNCEIRVDQPEMPGGDGSSALFVDAIDAAGVVAQSAQRGALVVDRPIRVGDESGWLEARPAAAGSLSIEYQLDYGRGNPIGRQTIQLDLNPDTFRTELARARTFLLVSEAEWLRRQGLGTRVTCRDVLVFDGTSVVDNELRYPDECVRHKALDLIGDLSLAGVDLIGRFVAYRSGHRLNATLVEALMATGRWVQPVRQSA